MAHLFALTLESVTKTNDGRSSGSSYRFFAFPPVN